MKIITLLLQYGLAVTVPYQPILPTVVEKTDARIVLQQNNTAINATVELPVSYWVGLVLLHPNMAQQDSVAIYGCLDSKTTQSSIHFPSCSTNFTDSIRLPKMVVGFSKEKTIQYRFKLPTPRANNPNKKQLWLHVLLFQNSKCLPNNVQRYTIQL